MTIDCMIEMMFVNLYENGYDNVKILYYCSYEMIALFHSHL